MSQTKKHSLIEQLVNQCIGFLLAWPINYFLMPLFGLPVGASKAFWITAVFTAVSIVRGYFVRRIFNQLHLNKMLSTDKPAV